MAECDRQIEAHLESFAAQTEESLPPRGRGRKAFRNQLKFDARAQVHRITGVDLTKIDGIDEHVALKVLSEIGTDMSRWPTVKHFTSWLGLCPRTERSGGKTLSGHTKPCANRAAAALRLAATLYRRSRPWERTCGV